MGGDALHDASELTYVGKSLLWSRDDHGALVAEFVILFEQDDRMLVFHRKRGHLQWMTHARVLLTNHSHVLELVEP